MKMVHRLLRMIFAISFCISAILWQVSESAVVGPSPQNDQTTPYVDPCVGFSCTHPRTCEVDPESNQPTCVCQTICFEIYEPICGSNGKTYANTCYLRVDACQTNSIITEVYDGTCEEMTCSKKRCSKYKQCVVNTKGRPRCVCNDVCPDVVIPVCGSDGETYNNECELKRTACTSNTTIKVSKQGACDQDPCAAVRCVEGKRCVVDAKNRPECVCNEACDRLADPVCGSDGETYSNNCELLIRRCKNDQNLTVVCNGECAKGGTKKNPKCLSVTNN